MATLIEVVAAVVVDGGHFLACRRSQARGGRWEFPGGKVEPGEDLDSALKREILEELAVEINVGDSIATTEVPELGIRLVSFEATLVGDRPTTSTDHDRLLWLKASELSELEWERADVPTVHALLRR